MTSRVFARLPAWTRNPKVLFFVLITFLSFFTYFYRYWDPPHVFWDENYHIASAQKYLHGVYFMEQHPPLGKLLVALGEKVLHPNLQTDQFLGTDYGTEFEGISFVGYRFFSALLSWLAAPLLYLLFFRITKHPLSAALISFLYVFDNALVVHNRGAMLEGPLMFFATALLLLFFHLIEEKRESRFLLLSAAFGVVFGLVLTTKVLGLIFVLLFPVVCFLALESKRDRVRLIWTGVFAAAFVVGLKLLLAGLALFASRISIPPITGLYQLLTHPIFLTFLVLLFVAAIVRSLFRLTSTRPLVFLGFSAVGFLVTYAAVWQIHFSLGKTINPALPDQGFYQASEEYKDVLARGVSGVLTSFPVMLRDSLKFVGHYNNGAPRLDLCKRDENGSPFYLWPLGARTINYRWETPDGNEYRYLYLVPNPIVWWGAFAAVLLAAGLLLVSVVAPLKQPLKRPLLLLTFLGMYASYLIAISRIERVLYLYHYFIPLLFSFILFGLVVDEIRTIGRFTIRERERTAGLLGFGLLAFLAFLFYSPLTYYQPLSDAQMQRRAFFPLWELSCVKCEKVNGVAIPSK